MNSMAKRALKNLDSKSYRPMQNDLGDEDSKSTKQGRLRLGRRKKTTEKGVEAPPLVPPKKQEEEKLDQSWTGEFPSEFKSQFSAGVKPESQNSAGGTHNHRSSIDSGSHAESTEAAVIPTITKPAPRSHAHAASTPAGLRGSATVFSGNTLEASDQVEKPSITSPNNAARKRLGTNIMLSEKPINKVGTINTLGSTNSSETGTPDSAFRPSIASLPSIKPPMTDLAPGLPRQTVKKRERLHLQEPKSNDMSLSDQMSTSSRQAGETEEDSMMRLAMEVSLLDFEEKQKQERQASVLAGMMQSQPDTPSPTAGKREELQDRLTGYNRQGSQHSVLSASAEEVTEVLVENHRGLQRNRRSTAERPDRPITSPGGSNDPSMVRQLQAARENLSKEEADEIERALRDAGEVDSSPTPSASPSRFASTSQHLSTSEAAEIERAIREADEQEQQNSINVALRLEAEEAARYNRSRQPQRVASRDDDMAQHTIGAYRSSSPQRIHSLEIEERRNFDGFQTNSNHDQASDQDRVNGVEADKDIAFVENTDYNAFINKGVASALSPDPDTSDSDSQVRLQISRAVNNGLIEHCNGIVKEGKEATVYHADQGEGSHGHAVAIKVYKRINESHAEKEYRNLIRANSAHVPVASPLFQKENLVFMRFMGEDGWPSPQLKDLELETGSETWTILYSQIMVAVRRLYVTAHLVHADLSDHNILVCPANVVENKDEGAGTSADGDEIQAVLIGFAQAVDVQHPQASELLERDLDQIHNFFFKKGIKTLVPKMAIDFVTAPDADASEGELKFEEMGGEDEAQKMTAIATEGVKHSAYSDSTKSTSTSSSPSFGSPVREMVADVTDLVEQRRISMNSISTKSSSFSSRSTGRDRVAAGLKQPKQPRHATGSPGSTMGSEKAKKVKKEKKEKKKKKEPSSGKQQSKKPEQDQPTILDFFPSRAGSPDSFFEGPAEFPDVFQASGSVDWETEWNEEFTEVEEFKASSLSPFNTSPLSP